MQSISEISEIIALSLILGPVNHFDSAAFLYKDYPNQNRDMNHKFERNQAPEKLVVSIDLTMNISCSISRRN